MAAKIKSDVKVLKGQEAEDTILEYVRRMNRPYGAVDVAANLKGAVPKATTQKILVSLAEKGELVQKLYGKTTFFVANQDKVATLPAEEIAALEAENKTVEEEYKGIAAEIKIVTGELAKVKSTPSDAELDIQIAELEIEIQKKTALLEPLRSGAPLISAEELAQIDDDWIKWRQEWIRRRKVFKTLWQLITDTLSPQDATDLAEDLGIEFDTPEHFALEQSKLCTTGMNPLKRKR